MASNLTAQVRNIAEVTTAVAQRRPFEEDYGRCAGRNPRAEEHHQHDGGPAQRHSPSEVTRVAREVGTEGKLGGQADVRGVAGTWKDLTDNVNSMAGNLTVSGPEHCRRDDRRRERATFRRRSRSMCSGEILELKNTINTMVDQLSSFAAEVTRVAREVGTEGKLGGQADVRGVGGVWKDLTDNVNSMASQPHRPGAKHRRCHHCGCQRRPVQEKSPWMSKARSSSLKNTINRMVDQLSSFAIGSDARGARGRYRRKTGRPG